MKIIKASEIICNPPNVIKDFEKAFRTEVQNVNEQESKISENNIKYSAECRKSLNEKNQQNNIQILNMFKKQIEISKDVCLIPLKVTKKDSERAIAAKVENINEEKAKSNENINKDSEKDKKNESENTKEKVTKQIVQPQSMYEESSNNTKDTDEAKAHASPKGAKGKEISNAQVKNKQKKINNKVLNKSTNKTKGSKSMYY